MTTRSRFRFEARLPNRSVALLNRGSLGPSRRDYLNLVLLGVKPVSRITGNSLICAQPPLVSSIYLTDVIVFTGSAKKAPSC